VVKVERAVRVVEMAEMEGEAVHCKSRQDTSSTLACAEG
jgi:hypothetical protein